MDIIFGILSSPWLLIGLVVAAVAIAVYIYVRARYKIADANEALVITGGKGEPKILVGGGAFVPPFRKADFFDLGLKTVSSTNEATHTNTMIPVIVEWTAQLRPDISKDENGQLNESLRNAILGFTNYGGEIADSLQQSLEGEVRAVIATMTPENLVRNKSDFTEQVDTNVKSSMAELGFKLVSLNIGKITDPNGYYENLAAKDREEKRREAMNLKADADQGIAVRSAEADEASKGAEQKRDLAVAQQARELALRRAAIKAETDTAEADAEIAGQLQRELRNQELATREGEVAVVRERQNQAAAIARREVEVTQAETEKQKAQIAAEAQAQQDQIAAEAAALISTRKAKGEADSAVAKAQGEADAIKRTTEAETNQIRQTGLAEAEVAKAKGEAEAAAILAKGEAEAAVQQKMAEALAANDGANLRVTLAEIDRDTQIKIYTTVGEAMARVGEHATFIDMGGSSSEGGDLLSNVLGNVPELLKRLDVKSAALNGAPFGATVGSVVSAIGGKHGSADAESGDPTEASAPVPTELTLESLAQALNVDPTQLQALAQMLPSSSPKSEASVVEVDSVSPETESGEAETPAESSAVS